MLHLKQSPCLQEVDKLGSKANVTIYRKKNSNMFFYTQVISKIGIFVIKSFAFRFFFLKINF